MNVFVVIILLIENIMVDTFSVKTLLGKIGKDVFINILYPELRGNGEVAVGEIAAKYPRFSTFTPASQRTRLSNAKRIMADKKMIKEALDIIMASKRLEQECKNRAENFYKEL